MPKNFDTVQKYLDYFEDMARKHKEILHTDDDHHFYDIDIEEVLAELRSGINFPCLIVECFSGGLEDGFTDNIHDKKTGAFEVLMSVPSRGANGESEYDLRKQVLDKTFRICMDIISRMRKDSRRTNNNLPPFLTNFDPNTVQYFKVGPVYENCYGWRFEHSFSEPAAIAYDENRWTS